MLTFMIPVQRAREDWIYGLIDMGILEVIEDGIKVAKEK